MKKLTLFTALIIAALLAAAFTPFDVALAQDTRGAAIPVLQSPHGTIVDSTPTYKWYKLKNAEKYQFQVYRGTTKILDKTIESSLCGVTYCARTPALKLMTNAHKWRVRARISGSWSAWSTYLNFFRSAPAFDSQFNGTMDGWERKSGGTWNIYNYGYLISSGLSDKYTSAYNTSGKYSDFDYTVQMLRESNDPTYLTFRMGSSIGKSERWYPGYLFGFSNDGSYGIFRLSSENGVNVLQAWTPTTAIVPNSFNRLRVVAKGTNLKFYINNVLLKTLTDSTYRNGYVGVMQFSSIATDHTDIIIAEAQLSPIQTPQ